MQKKIHNLIPILTLISIGWCSGQYFENFSLFAYSTEIELMDVITLAVTVFIAWYVAQILQKRGQDERFEKELIIARIDDVDNALIKLSAICFSKDPVRYDEVTHILSNTRKWTKRFRQIIEERYNTLHEKEENRFVSVSRKIIEVNRLCTYTPPAGIDDDIQISNGTIIYTSQRCLQIDAVLESIRDELLQLKIIVNNH